MHRQPDSPRFSPDLWLTGTKSAYFPGRPVSVIRRLTATRLSSSRNPLTVSPPIWTPALFPRASRPT